MGVSSGTQFYGEGHSLSTLAVVKNLKVKTRLSEILIDLQYKRALFKKKSFEIKI